MLGLFHVLNNLADLPRKALQSLYANLSPKAKKAFFSSKRRTLLPEPSAALRVLLRCKITGVI